MSKVIIFDMDGTIIDSSKAIEITINDIRADMGLEPLATAYITRVINEPGRNLAFDLYGLQNPSSSLKAGFEKNFKKNYDLYARCYEGIKDLLNSCKDAGFKLVLASNAPSHTLAEILAKNEILHLFDEVIGAGNGVAEKPNPQMLHLAVEKTGALKAVFVGDSLKDEMAAKNAKMPYVHVTWGFGTASSNPDFLVDTTKKAWEIIKEI
ncbi:HAD family hydrolase [Campylobacter majalis]|uniref:HAD family hydrolase n=1 Tax=Campylobacter majalis TaxID=2790656 RepID=UPI003D691828